MNINYNLNEDAIKSNHELSSLYTAVKNKLFLDETNEHTIFDFFCGKLISDANDTDIREIIDLYNNVILRKLSVGCRYINARIEEYSYHTVGDVHIINFQIGSDILTTEDKIIIRLDFKGKNRITDITISIYNFERIVYKSLQVILELIDTHDIKFSLLDAYHKQFSYMYKPKNPNVVKKYSVLGDRELASITLTSEIKSIIDSKLKLYNNNLVVTCNEHDIGNFDITIKISDTRYDSNIVEEGSIKIDLLKQKVDINEEICRYATFYR